MHEYIHTYIHTHITKTQLDDYYTCIQHVSMEGHLLPNFSIQLSTNQKDRNLNSHKESVVHESVCPASASLDLASLSLSCEQETADADSGGKRRQADSESVGEWSVGACERQCNMCGKYKQVCLCAWRVCMHVFRLFVYTILPCLLCNLATFFLFMYTILLILPHVSCLCKESCTLCRGLAFMLATN